MRPVNDLKSLAGTSKGNREFLWQLAEYSVYDNELLKNQDGDYKGFPFRTYAGNRYLGGFSDHFPVYIILER